MFKTASGVAMILVALLDAPTINARAIDLDSPAIPAHGGNGDPSTSMKNLLSSDGIDWNTFLAIQVAAAEASRRGVKLKNCRITAAEWGERLLVSFGNPDPSHRWRGCPPGPCTCFDVELSIDGLRLLAAHFSK